MIDGVEETCVRGKEEKGKVCPTSKSYWILDDGMRKMGNFRQSWGSSSVGHFEGRSWMESIQEIRRRRMTSLSVAGGSTQSRWNYESHCSAGRGSEPWRHRHRTGHSCWGMTFVLGIPEDRRGSCAVHRCKSDGLGSMTKTE